MRLTWTHPHIAGACSPDSEQLSDQVWQVYGDGDVSPAYLAYLDEVCAVANNWLRYSPGSTSVMSIMAAAHLPCTSHSEPVELADSAVDALLRDHTCIVLSPGDPVSPSELLLRTISGQESVVMVDDRDHQSLRGLTDCLAQVGALE